MPKFRPPALLASALVLASTCLFATEIKMASEVPYAQNAEIAENILHECTKLQSQLAHFTREFAARHDITVHLESSVSVDTPGRNLIVHIDDAVSMGNAFTRHAKFTRISGSLYQDGEFIAGFRGRRNSGGGAFGGYKGSCSVLGRTVRALGSDIASWLNNPVDGARLGDM